MGEKTLAAAVSVGR